MNMKITLSVLLLFACTTLLTAQVGIGTTTPAAGALLDIHGDNGGIVIPRVELVETTDQAPIIGPTPVTGLMVYNSAPAVNDVSPGFYYWNGSAWERMASGASTDWSLTGNAGTTAGTNFIGTTDNIDFRVRTNNAQRFNFTNNGRLRAFVNGDAAQPTYSWNDDNNTGIFRPAADNLAFSTNGAERMRIIANGRIGINQITPLGYMHLSSPLEGALPIGGPGIYSEITVTNSNWSAIETYNPNIAGGSGMTSTGFFGVRGNTTDIALGWAGFFNGDIISRDNWVDRDIIALWGVSELSNTNTDDLTVFGTFTNPSDIRIKSNIDNINNGLDVINSLKPKKYLKRNDLVNRSVNISKKKNNNESKLINSNSVDISNSIKNEKNNEVQIEPFYEFGFIAQELEKILPELVIEKKTNIEGLGEIDLKSVNYIGLIPILTQAIQEQQEIIDNQESRIAKLEALVNQLMNKN